MANQDDSQFYWSDGITQVCLCQHLHFITVFRLKLLFENPIIIHIYEYIYDLSSLNKQNINIYRTLISLNALILKNIKSNTTHTIASWPNPKQRASYQIRKIAGCACAGNAGKVFPRGRLQRKLLVSDPDMHHGTCVTHVPWCMSGSLNRGGGENVPGIPGACASRNITYLARGPWHVVACSVRWRDNENSLNANVIRKLKWKPLYSHWYINGIAIQFFRKSLSSIWQTKSPFQFVKKEFSGANILN